MAQIVKNLPSNTGDLGSTPWGGKIPWISGLLPTPVLLSGQFYGQRSLAGYSPQGCRESDMTE